MRRLQLAARRLLGAAHGKASNRRRDARGIGGFAIEDLDVRTIFASEEWAYRHRITLRVDGEQRLGFYRHRSHELVEIDECRIADANVNAHLGPAREWLRGVSTTVRRVEVASTRDGRAVFVANAEGPFRHDGDITNGFSGGALPSPASCSTARAGGGRSEGRSSRSKSTTSFRSRPRAGSRK